MTWDIIEINETDSTNDEIKKHPKKKEGLLISALWQTGGRGQKGNRWESTRGENLLFSFYVMPTTLFCKDQFYLSKVVSLALVDLLDEHNIQASIKWPNDIYVGNQKICGVLIESSLTANGYLKESVIGIGLNINQRVFTSDVPNPISMAQITKTDYQREAILQRFTHHFDACYHLLRKESFDVIDRRYKALLYRMGRWCEFNDENRFEGRIVDVAPTGELCVERRDGTRRHYLFKQIEYIIEH